MRARPLIFRLLSALPVSLSSRLGAWIAPLLAPRQMPLRDGRARTNLALLLPDLDARARAALLARRWANLGRYLFELPAMRKLDRPEHFEVDPDLEAVLDNPRPLVLVTLHIGNWELGSHLFTRSKRRGIGIHQPRADPTQAKLLDKARGGYAVTVIPPGTGAARKALRELRRDHAAVFLLLDERRDRQVWFPFLGRTLPPSGNLSVALRLARLSGAAILPFLFERTAATRFRVHWHPPLQIDQMGEDAVVAELDRWFGAAALRHADQWLGLHDMTVDPALGFTPQAPPDAAGPAVGAGRDVSALEQDTDDGGRSRSDIASTDAIRQSHGRGASPRPS